MLPTLIDESEITTPDELLEAAKKFLKNPEAEFFRKASNELLNIYTFIWLVTSLKFTVSDLNVTNRLTPVSLLSNFFVKLDENTNGSGEKRVKINFTDTGEMYGFKGHHGLDAKIDYLKKFYGNMQNNETKLEKIRSGIIIHLFQVELQSIIHMQKRNNTVTEIELEQSTFDKSAVKKNLDEAKKIFLNNNGNIKKGFEHLNLALEQAMFSNRQKLSLAIINFGLNKTSVEYLEDMNKLFETAITIAVYEYDAEHCISFFKQIRSEYLRHSAIDYAIIAIENNKPEVALWLLDEALNRGSQLEIPEQVSELIGAITRLRAEIPLQHQLYQLPAKDSSLMGFIAFLTKQPIEWFNNLSLVKKTGLGLGVVLACFGLSVAFSSLFLASNAAGVILIGVSGAIASVYLYLKGKEYQKFTDVYGGKYTDNCRTAYPLLENLSDVNNYKGMILSQSNSSYEADFSINPFESNDGLNEILIEQAFVEPIESNNNAVSTGSSSTLDTRPSSFIDADSWKPRIKALIKLVRDFEPFRHRFLFNNKNSPVEILINQLVQIQGQPKSDNENIEFIQTAVSEFTAKFDPTKYEIQIKNLNDGVENLKENIEESTPLLFKRFTI